MNNKIYPIINFLTRPYKILENILNPLTMYRVTLYSLAGLVIYALFLALFNFSSLQLWSLLSSLLVIVATASLAHYFCAKLTKAPANYESTLITALILFLILTPSNETISLLTVGIIAIVAIILKYALTYHHRHIFNPAALALFLAGLTGYFGAEWWVGSRLMLPAVIVAGLLVTAKTRRLNLVAIYLIISTLTSIIVFSDGRDIWPVILQHFLSWPTVFFATIMLTEPLSLPGTKKIQYLYASLIAILSTTPYSFFNFIYGTPELALIVGNLLAFFIIRPSRYTLKFIEKKQIGENAYEYYFQPNYKIKYQAGQYLEWTLPHDHHDKRGIRRYFTISSSPNDPYISFAIRQAGNLSSWKKHISEMLPGATIFASQLAGDFLLRDRNKKSVWIAGGIGITPFIAMIRQALASGYQLNATLFFCCNNNHDMLFSDILNQAKDIGLKIVYVCYHQPLEPMEVEVGTITEAMLKKHLLDLKADFYISGPPIMVTNYKSMLQNSGVSAHNIITDYFSGLA